MFPPPGKEELKNMAKAAELVAKDEDKILDCPWCGNPMMLTTSDYQEGETIVHNTPVFGCCTCDEILVDSDVAVLIESVVERTELPEIDFREINKLVESLPE